MLHFTNVQIKQSKNGEYKTATVSTDNQSVENVGIWKNAFQLYDSVKDGAELAGKLVQKGKYWNVTDLQPAVRPFTPRPSAQKAVSESVKVAQEAKGEAIKISSTMRDAVLIVTTFCRNDDVTNEQLQQKIAYWRKWLWQEWDKPSSEYPPFG